MSDTVSLVTRKFGLRPLEPGIKFPLDVFSRFERVVNVLIQYGIGLEDRLFDKDSLNSVKVFYDKVRKISAVLRKIKETGLRERARRCGAQFAYFSIREYKRRGKLISNLADIVFAQNDFSVLLNEAFPSEFLIEEARRAVANSFGNGYYNTNEFLDNMYRCLINLVIKIMKTECSREVLKGFDDLLIQGELQADILKYAGKSIHGEFKRFVRKLSVLTTKKVNKLIKNNLPIGNMGIDPLILKILTGNKIAKHSWEQARKKWRSIQLEKVANQLKKIDLKEITGEIFEKLKTRPIEYVVNLIFKPRARSPWIIGDTLEDFKAFFSARLLSRVEKEIASQLSTKLKELIRKVLERLKSCPWKYIKKPHFQRQTIPLAIDDGQVYGLEIEQEKDTNNIINVQLYFSFFKGQLLQFKMNYPDRFDNMIKRGYNPLRGTLSKRPAGGLVISIPFTKDLGHEMRSNSKDTQDIFIVAGLDVGLKILGTVSIDKCMLNQDGVWKKVNPEKGDMARYFIDQKQLIGNKKDCFLKIELKKEKRCNFKRKLTQLQKISRIYQAKTKKHVLKNSKNHKNKVKYWRLKREWKRAWQKMQNIHQELIRQLATRTIEILLYHKVEILRLEDLSWAKHSKKNEVGYFLTTWQVHWFHAKLQKTLAEMAARETIKVEWINPRNTSKNCSKCGKIGIRTGKTFKCPHCGFEIHADLNSARNICIAPNSPAAICGRGRCPLPSTS